MATTMPSTHPRANLDEIDRQVQNRRVSLRRLLGKKSKEKGLLEKVLHKSCQWKFLRKKLLGKDRIPRGNLMKILRKKDSRGKSYTEDCQGNLLRRRLAWRKSYIKDTGKHFIYWLWKKLKVTHIYTDMLNTNKKAMVHSPTWTISGNSSTNVGSFRLNMPLCAASWRFCYTM